LTPQTPCEGYRKLGARLRFAGIRTSRRRVLRLMREHGLLAHRRAGRPHGSRAHDGTITTERVDVMWGTDLTSVMTGEGQAAVFLAVDHCSAECVGIHASRSADRFEALEPVRQAVREHFGGGSYRDPGCWVLYQRPRFPTGAACEAFPPPRGDG
jgi:putative transposase